MPSFAGEKGMQHQLYFMHDLQYGFVTCAVISAAVLSLEHDGG